MAQDKVDELLDEILKEKQRLDAEHILNPGMEDCPCNLCAAVKTIKQGK